MFVSAPAREPDVWLAEADVKSLRVYWKVSFRKVKTEMLLKRPLAAVSDGGHCDPRIYTSRL